MKGYKQTVRHYYKKVEYTTAGTYTLTIPSNVTCEVVLVGGGGGGAYSNSYGSWANAQNGGSAGKITGKCALTAGNYTVVVGALGEGRYSTNGGGGATSSALAGGNTTFNGNIANGGGGAYTHTGYFDSQGSPGSAGTFTVKTSGLTGSNGASGSTTGRYNNYGAGGSGNGGSNTGNNGKSGYASFLFESTSSDYTYYVDVDTFSLAAEKVYYKYVYSSWTQPILSSNGTIGGNSFAVTASSYYDSPRQPFNAFDGQNAAESNCWHSVSGYPQWLEWYSPVPLKYSNIKIQNRTGYGNAVKDYQIQISDNGSNWETILTGTNTVSATPGEWNIDLSSIQPITKYMRIYATTSYDSSYVVIGEVTITAQQQSTTSGTSSDYDFYKYTYKAFNV